MKAVILAGGLGTRLSEETSLRPKPMVEIGGRPILWHIMKLYSVFGVNEFVICCGYKGYVIKEYFINYFSHMSDVTVDFASGDLEVHKRHAENWKVTLVDTGEESMTGGRLLRVREYLENEESFCLTYGDGVADVNINELIAFHNSHSGLATVTGVYPPGRFGALSLEGNRVDSFVEKPEGDGGRINGGFFVLSPKVLDLLTGDDCIWEQAPLRSLASSGDLFMYEHDGFWQPMDTLRDKTGLESLWANQQAPWKLW